MSDQVTISVRQTVKVVREHDKLTCNSISTMQIISFKVIYIFLYLISQVFILNHWQIKDKFPVDDSKLYLLTFFIPQYST